MEEKSMFFKVLLVLFCLLAPLQAQDKHEVMLQELEAKIEDLENRVWNFNQGILEMGKQIPDASGMSFWSTSNTRLLIDENSEELRGSNGLRIYNATRFSANIDPQTTARLGLFLQKGFGSQRAFSAVSSIEAGLETAVKLGNNSWRFSVGHFTSEMTPLTLSKLYRQQDLEKDLTILRGVKASSTLENLNFTTFVAKMRDGAGQRPDQYLFAVETETELFPRIPLKLYHWQLIDDKYSGPIGSLLTTEATTSLVYRYPLQILSFSIPITGELATYVKDDDLLDSLDPVRDYALRVEGQFPLRIRSRGRWRIQPLNFTYHRIGSKFNSGGLSAVRDWEEDFILDYEENPYELEFIRNFQALKINLPDLRLMDGLNLQMKYNHYTELKPKIAGQGRIYKSLSSRVVYSSWSIPLAFEGIYENYFSGRKGTDAAVVNSWGGLYCSKDLSAGTRLRIGSELWQTLFHGELTRRELRPLIGLSRGLGDTTVELSFQPVTGMDSYGQLWRAEVRSTIGPRTSFNFRYKGSFRGEKYEQYFLLTYNTSY